MQDLDFTPLVIWLIGLVVIISILIGMWYLIIPKKKDITIKNIVKKQSTFWWIIGALITFHFNWGFLGFLCIWMAITIGFNNWVEKQWERVEKTFTIH